MYVEDTIGGAVEVVAACDAYSMYGLIECAGVCGQLATGSSWVHEKRTQNYADCMPERDLQAVADENRVVLIQITLTLQIWRPYSFVFTFLSTVPCSPNRNSRSCQSQIPTSCKHSA